MSSEEWGPWVEHDGASVVGRIPNRCIISVTVTGKGKWPPHEGIGHDWPGFFWRWKRVKTGWFKSELRPVCDDPAYAPIIRYRIRRPRALRELIELVENLPEPAPRFAPEDA